MSEYMPEDMPDRMPEDMSDRMPEDMPDRMPEDLPDRMPEDMSDRMPEDLPVRKCKNVTVGITRSKVFFFENRLVHALLSGAAPKGANWIKLWPRVNSLGTHVACRWVMLNHLCPLRA